MSPVAAEVRVTGHNGVMLPAAILLPVLEHLGKLHRYEAIVVYVLAFGPFLLLAVTVWIARKRVTEEDEESTGSEPVTKRGD